LTGSLGAAHPRGVTETFSGSFTRQEPIPDEGIAAAVALMRTGRLHRYSLAPGEMGEVSALEREFADLVGARYALAVASGGYGLRCALRALGVGSGDLVLTNAFTLAPVPGAIAALGAGPCYVGVTEALTIDLDDLAAKADRARVLLLSHMRGHVADMDRVVAICAAAGIAVVEDCAHTLGASYRGTPSGRHGVIGCYSTQSYKHVNSGEGGLIVTDDADLAARMVLMSGSYGFHDRHGAAPGPEAFAELHWQMPNVSGRMDAVRAAMLRPQLGLLAARRAAWNARYAQVEAGLRGVPGLTLIARPPEEAFVGSSIQWLLTDWPAPRIARLVEACRARGVELKWFGAESPQGFTSTYRHWRYAASEPLPATDRILAGLIDMRLSLSFTLEDCALIARIVADETRRAPTDQGAGGKVTSR
jgi:dTDP-4-amino-4,6-dideoxygalactose transaminase